MTYFAYGSFRHEAGQVNLTRMNIAYKHSPRGRRLSRVMTMFLQGEICGDSQSSLTTQINQLISAYSVDYQNAGLYLDDGSLSPHQLPNDTPECISGVRVMQRSWPKGGPSEYATARTFSVTLQAEYADFESDLVQWEETLEYIGNCGPRYEILETYDGPYSLLTATRTAQRIIQSGSAVGFRGYVLPPGSLFPLNEHQDRRRVKVGSPKYVGRGFAYYPTAWSYYHTMGSPVEAYPNIR